MKTFVFVYLAASFAMFAFLTWIGTVHEGNKQARGKKPKLARGRGVDGVRVLHDRVDSPISE